MKQVDFTREPIIESIITPREGFKLAVRGSRGVGQEEYFVEAVEIVAFGQALFFRSLERPKCFLVPVTEYEIVEIREARMVLKNVGSDNTIKIAGGKEPRPKVISREVLEKVDIDETVPSTFKEDEIKIDKKRDKRRQNRRRRGRDERSDSLQESDVAEVPTDCSTPKESERRETILNAILPPPTRLISETLERYRGDESFKGVFHTTAESEKEMESGVERVAPPIEIIETYFEIDLPKSESSSDSNEAVKQESEEN